MIVPMKKIAVIVRSEDAQNTLHELRDLGVMHVENQQAPSGKNIASIRDDIVTLDKVITVLSAPEYRNKSTIKPGERLENWRFTAKHILDTFVRVDHLEEYSRSLTARIAEWEMWGDFDPEALEGLRRKGLFVKLCRVPLTDFSALAKKYTVRVIAQTKVMACCAIVSLEEISVPYKDEGLPKMGLNKMRARLAEDADTVSALKKALRECSGFIGQYIGIRKALDKELEFHEALKGMGEAERISYIVGYIPADASEAVIKKAKAAQWGISIKDPSGEDNVPTLVRNPRWISTIAPIFKLIEIVPGYKEMDISPVLLLFLSLFFGMIIGDAGYGVLYIIATFFVQTKIGRRMQDQRIFHLLYLFSASAVLWGILTGTVFGQEWYLRAGFKAILPILNDTKELQAFCFFLGALHLTIAQAWQGLRKLPSITAVADAGWICILWAAYFLARMLILGDSLPGYTKWLIAAGVAIVILFTCPQKNVLKMIGQGIGAVALNIINNFTDVVSYIRLFAVGLAGVAISDTVNTLAAETSGGNMLLYTLIVFAGHTINILLGPLSVMVHGIRLNVLEFSSHAGLTWSGTVYKPLKQ